MIVSGPHRFAPVEIHAGRPILFGLGNFVWSDLSEPFQGYFHRHSRAMIAAVPDPAWVTDADLTGALNAETFDDEDIFRAALATIRFEAGALSEVRRIPVELGFGEALTRSGIPRAAAPAPQAILERMRAISEPFGTTMTFEDEVAVIRL